jgi:hypothetical protein
MHYLMQNIERYLLSCRELTAFCSQNGWIDNQSMNYEIIEQNDHGRLWLHRRTHSLPGTPAAYAGSLRTS